ncbi:MAG: single-stranded DNA-binding protein [Ancrocorticia sp.]|jgi:single-strand DNA-binding protein|nr:single-stranded DNA-binding protein [Ancrocorticia sp.]MCI1932819.1 single-stranded DNA-binding protein [Ancrocorticia sp.]MCI1963615.1 single-stranded DNA-binding protein [Ancrocorticia sp.]MCI2012116.1 single-stranded DNA-binding protein [Ancrocorticia sp.]MCI2029807.1 single-stranded DNA-binding protein [Ancrocorticia sp.]
MAGEPIVTIVGNLTADPDLRYISSGVAVASFTVASTPRTQNRQTGQWEDGEAMFVRCSVWREYAENVAESLSKGMRVIAHGRMTVRSYESNTGEKRQSIELQVDEVGPSLRYARAQVTRVSGGNSGNYQAGNSNSRNQGRASFDAPQGGSAHDPWQNGPAGGSAFDDAPPF